MHDVGDGTHDVDADAVGDVQTLDLVHAQPQEHALPEVVGPCESGEGHIPLRQPGRVLDGSGGGLEAVQIDVVGQDVADRGDVSLDAGLQHFHQVGVAAQVGDPRGEQVAHLPHDLGDAHIEVPRDEGEQLADIELGFGRFHAAASWCGRRRDLSTCSARCAAFTPHMPCTPGPGGVAAEQM